jgi:hypothetical protein
MTISRDTLTTNIWDTVYTYLQTTNPISTNNIFSSMNSTLLKSKGYPIVIMETPLASIEKLNVTGSFTQSDIAINFSVYHTSNQNIKVLKDEVVAKLLAGRYVFAGVGLKRMMIEDGTYDNWDEGKKKIHRLSFAVKFFYAEQ